MSRDLAVRAPGHAASERGSALVIAVMVSVLVTMLGFSLVIIADTENRISVAQRDEVQTLYAAVSGAKMVETWFNQPNRSQNAFVPSRAECDLERRVGDSDYDGVDDIDVPTNGAVQRYRGGTAAGTYQLFDRPYRGAVRDTFWGGSETPDVLLTNDLDTDGEFLDGVSGMFNPANGKSFENIYLTEIKIYAPPYDDTLQRRYGICTISVTAGKYQERGSWRKQLAERTVTVVLNELPLPTPGAAIEAEGTVGLQGNFGVHWGGTFTEGDMSVQAGANFPGNSIPRLGTAQAFAWDDFSPNAPDLDPATAGTQNLLTQLLDGPAEIRDPWLIFRANGTIEEATNPDDQPWPYDYATGVAEDRSIFYQNQFYAFPVMDYAFWKEFTQARSRNSHYHKYAGAGPVFQLNGVGTAHEFAHWVNTENPDVEPGIFFFDTSNNQNPQNGGPGILSDEILVNAGTIDSPSGDFIMEGMVFSNASVVNTSGIGTLVVDRVVSMPAEPFLDTGIDIDRSGTVGDTAEEQETIGNGVWDYAYPTSTESDGPLYADQYGTADFNAFEASHQYGDGVVPDDGLDPRIVPDVVHEPFLNFHYPGYTGPTDEDTYVDYDYELTERKALGDDRDGDGVDDTMTSLRDIKGAEVTLGLALNGIWYNEGAYDGVGNLPVYGSLLMRAGYNSTGTPDVYFNEALFRGNWPPDDMHLARVYATQMNSGR
jgi:hypothetical protein